MDAQIFTERVKASIKERGLKQSYLAKQIGMSPQLFNGKLHGTSEWRVDQVLKLSKILEIPLDVWRA